MQYLILVGHQMAMQPMQQLRNLQKQGTTGNLRFGVFHAEVYDLLRPPQNHHNSKKAWKKGKGNLQKFWGVRTVNATFDSHTYVSTRKWKNTKIFFQLKKQRTIAWWWLETFFFHPVLGKMIQFDVYIFFKWIGEKSPTTNNDPSRVTAMILYLSLPIQKATHVLHQPSTFTKG